MIWIINYGWLINKYSNIIIQVYYPQYTFTYNRSLFTIVYTTGRKRREKINQYTINSPSHYHNSLHKPQSSVERVPIDKLDKYCFSKFMILAKTRNPTRLTIISKMEQKFFSKMRNRYRIIIIQKDG